MSALSTEDSVLPASPLITYAAVFTVGIFLSTLHWLGLLVGGILVGLFAPSLRRGILYGALFGLTSWVVFAIWLTTMGIVPSMDGIQIYGVSLAIPVILGAIGGTARELRPLVRSVIPG